MVRVDIETIVMATGSVPSLVVLRERASEADGGSTAPLRVLSIQTGPFEAAAISRGIEGVRGPRPITHDLFISTLAALGARLERVEINRVEAPIFYSRLIIARNRSEEIALDARPSDALALAVRSNAPIYVEDDVMNRASSAQRRTDEESRDEELDRFDRFAHTVTPDDF
ncbi:protein of unknown function DUF151 [Coriobacterium glomerans PW2]|uniref:BFN domain-containing protein n=1 Tax=Coriobacterium glomerans (strain ATCC 49209 / DSM 20642 / JCM 10262 / PW2) TaxID=700015 RepID=F2N6U0_CORGP|nr:bifunctional nuclease family protein [Coriobacterium glomerans]AEB06139.1 protein of unknown function DUF151 [Coriobacterium glomerans PW2]